MGGPGCGILLRQKQNESERAALVAYIDRIGEDLTVNRHVLNDGTVMESFDFAAVNLRVQQEPRFIMTVKPVPAWVNPHPRPFGYSYGIDCDIDLPLGTEQTFHDAFGFLPSQCINVWGYCNDRMDHAVLAEIAADIADLFNGVIDFGGTLWPPLPEGSSDKARREGTWYEDIEPVFQEIIRGMPGKIIGLMEETCDVPSIPCHYCDSTFLRAWIDHPHFHMIK